MLGAKKAQLKKLLKTAGSCVRYKYAGTCFRQKAMLVPALDKSYAWSCSS